MRSTGRRGKLKYRGHFCSRVIRAVLTAGRSLPVHPLYSDTPVPTATSQKCHIRTQSKRSVAMKKSVVMAMIASMAPAAAWGQSRHSDGAPITSGFPR